MSERNLPCPSCGYHFGHAGWCAKNPLNQTPDQPQSAPAGEACICRTPEPNKEPRPSDCPRHHGALYPEIGMAAYLSQAVIPSEPTSYRDCSVCMASMRDKANYYCPDHTLAPAPPASESVAAVEPGCTCGGLAACEQCQDRDAESVAVSDVEALAIHFWKIGTPERYRGDESTVKDSIWMDVAAEAAERERAAREQVLSEAAAEFIADNADILHAPIRPGTVAMRLQEMARRYADPHRAKRVGE